MCHGLVTRGMDDEPHGFARGQGETLQPGGFELVVAQLLLQSHDNLVMQLLLERFELLADLLADRCGGT